jgi:hypothetical protein
MSLLLAPLDLPTLPTNVGYQGKTGSDSEIVNPSLLTRRRHQLSPAQRQLNPFAHAALLLEHTMEGVIASSVA